MMFFNVLSPGDGRTIAAVSAVSATAKLLRQSKDKRRIASENFLFMCR
jgi:hypothetical protein